MDISLLRERRTSQTFTVGELNSYLKSIIENDRALKSVTVTGEISNFVAHTSGHLYFSLKDDSGQVKAIMFRTSAQKLKFMPENGMKVTAHGSVSVYTQGGTYQLYVNTLTADGVGALYLAYEQLKEKLSGEGLFDEAHKKLIPRIPRAVGVITSPTGAAVRDIINVTSRRFPSAAIYLYPSLVQGDGAEGELIKALDYFERSHLVDLIIIGRGGGSIEDLWAFNGEALARRIYSHSVPIISAVGHETDFTICDFVADLRAPTPSAAAELAVPDARDLLIYIDNMADRAVGALQKKAQRARERLSYLKDSRTLTSPQALFADKRRELGDLSARLMRSSDATVSEKRAALALLSEKLGALSPLAVLARGYAIAERAGAPVRTVDSVGVGDEMTVRLSDGALRVCVTGKSKKRKAKSNGN